MKLPIASCGVCDRLDRTTMWPLADRGFGQWVRVCTRCDRTLRGLWSYRLLCRGQWASLYDERR